jgi:hypothetical protein
MHRVLVVRLITHVCNIASSLAPELEFANSCVCNSARLQLQGSPHACVDQELGKNVSSISSASVVNQYLP